MGTFEWLDESENTFQQMKDSLYRKKNLLEHWDLNKYKKKINIYTFLRPYIKIIFTWIIAYI